MLDLDATEILFGYRELKSKTVYRVVFICDECKNRYIKTYNNNKLYKSNYDKCDKCRSNKDYEISAIIKENPFIKRTDVCKKFNISRSTLRRIAGPSKRQEKLTNEQIYLIKEEIELDILTHDEIAKIYNIGSGTVSAIKNKKGRYANY